MRSLLIVAIVTAFVTPLSLEASAQTFDHEIEKSNLPMSLSFGRVSEGLMAADITAMAQDGTGFLWAGGQEGLARYDGHEFVHLEEAEGYPGKSVSCMAVGKEGILYVGTYEHGLIVYDPKTGVFTELADGVSSKSISALYVDLDNNLWVGYGEGSYSVRKADGSWTNFGTLGTSAIIRKFRQSATGYWLATADQGVVFIDKIEDGVEVPYSVASGTFKGRDDEKKYLSSDAIVDIAIDKEGVLWIATGDAGLNRLNPATGEVTHYASSKSKRSLTIDTLTMVVVDQQDNVWVGSTTGLSLFDREQNNFHRFYTDDVDPTTMPWNWVTAGFVDAGGVVWLGHFQNGVSKVHPDQLKTPLYRAGNGALSLASDGDVLWSGTYDGLWAYDWGREILTKYHVFRDVKREEEFSLDGVWVTSIVVDSDNGTIWASTHSRGLVHFRPSTGEFEYFDLFNSQIATNSIKSLAKGPDGNIWVGTFDAGLMKLDVSDNTWQVWGPAELPELGSDYVSIVSVDAGGKYLWVGSTDVLLRLDPETMQTTPFRSGEDEATLPAGQVYALWQVENTMVIGTSNGLAELDIETGKVKRYSTDDGLSQEQVYGVVEANGEIWLSTNGGGVQRLDASRSTFTTYLSDDGMQGPEYAQGSYAKLPDGRVVLGGTKGFNLISPSEMERSNYVGPVVFTGVDVANKPFDFAGVSWDSDKVSMAHSSGIVKFKFASLGFEAPQLVRYKYRLKGFKGAEWEEVGADQRFATYTNLDGGDYEFEVMAQSRSGDWSEPAVMKLSVAPPLYKTWWAILIYIAIAVLIVLAYLKYQREKLEALEKDASLRKAENDLELTGAVQAGFLPKDDSVSNDYFGLMGYYKPAESCSGDWWWHEQQADGRYAVLVGDVTGHGPGPAMVTAAVATAYRVQSLVSGTTMAQRLAVLNDEVLRVSGGKYQMTLTAFTIDVQTGEFEIHSAGGLPVMSHEGGNARARSISCRGTPLGTENPVFGNVKGRLSPGSRVMVYTDGIPEVDMPNGRQIGMRRFAALFAETTNAAVPMATQHIVKTAEGHLQERPQDDDWTFVILQWGGPGYGAATL